jgi:hypothetical protein
MCPKTAHSLRCIALPPTASLKRGYPGDFATHNLPKPMRKSFDSMSRKVEQPLSVRRPGLATVKTCRHPQRVCTNRCLHFTSKFPKYFHPEPRASRYNPLRAVTFDRSSRRWLTSRSPRSKQQLRSTCLWDADRNPVPTQGKQSVPRPPLVSQ